MREIKFRAWNTGRRYQNRMFSWEEMIETLNEDSPYKSLFAPFLQSEQFKESPWVVLMQHTGLKDKNGKEIYEGDIVQRLASAKPGWGETTLFKGVVVFESGCFKFDGLVSRKSWDKPQKDKFVLGDRSEWEVIGNIYENPELLK